MKLYTLVKGLVRYSWLVALIVAIWSNIFIYIFKQPANKPILYSLLVGSRFLLAGFFNISILVMLDKVKLPVNGQWKNCCATPSGTSWLLFFSCLRNPGKTFHLCNRYTVDIFRTAPSYLAAGCKDQQPGDHHTKLFHPPVRKGEYRP